MSDKKGSFVVILRTVEESSKIRVGKFAYEEMEIFSTWLTSSLRSQFFAGSAPIDLSRYTIVYDGNSTFTFGATNATIGQLEVFEVHGLSSSIAHTNPTTSSLKKRNPINMFSNDVNLAINRKQDCLQQTEMKLLALENSFNEEEIFIDSFASGETNDVITLNVRGTIMITKRSTLRIMEDSVLALQFDDSKWTEHGYNNLRVKRWSADDVCAWVNTIEGIQENEGSIFRKNGITGCELLALTIDGLKMMGIERTGTLCLIQKEIEVLVKATQDVVSLIDHCPYCFGKILDYLRLKQLHAQGLVKDEPALPDVRKDMKQRFAKVVNFYFPGDAAKLILGA